MKQISIATIMAVGIVLCVIILAVGWAGVCIKTGTVVVISERYFELAEKIMLPAIGAGSVYAGGRIGGGNGGTRNQND